jgi:hypothetical protein
MKNNLNLNQVKYFDQVIHMPTNQQFHQCVLLLTNVARHLDQVVLPFHQKWAISIHY